MKKKDNPIYQAQAILAIRDHAEGEVRKKLAHKRFSADQIEAAIAWLYEQKLLNDAEFARRYAHSIVAIKPVGPRWLVAKLKQRGLGETHITSAIADVFTQHTEEKLAADAVARWRRMHPSVDNAREKLYRHLASRGFSPDAIASVIT